MQAYNHLNSITGNTECIQADKANDKEKNPLSILRSISRRAERKSDYLCKLQEYFSSNSNLSTTAGLLDYLSEDSTSENNALEVVKRNRLEITDPFHRNYEIEFNTDGKPEHKQANAISCAFAEWFDELGSGKNVPHFFIWLEGHDLCTANYRKICYDDNTNFKCSNTTNPKSVHQVNYSPNGLYAIKFKDGMVVYSKIGTNLSGLFDTSHVDDGKEKGAYAYVLTKAGDIIAAPHVGGKTHHSTLAMGKSVLCAGMIKAQQGKIVHVSNNSGHYQPPEANLREVVHILSVNNVFAQNAQIEVLSRSEPRLYSPSGFLSSKLKPRRSNQPVIRP